MFGQFRRKWKRSQSTCAFNFKGVFFVFLKLLVCCPGESIVCSVILNEMHSLIRYLELGKVDRLSSQNDLMNQRQESRVKFVVKQASARQQDDCILKF